MRMLLLSAILAISINMVAYAVEVQNVPNAEKEASSALAQATQVLEEAMSGTIVPEVQATKKGLDDLKKDMDAAIQNKKINAATVQNLQPEKMIAAAEEKMRLAEHYQQIAVQEITDAKTEPNLGMKYAKFKDAMAKAETARTITSTVSSVLAPQGQSSGQKESAQVPSIGAIRSIKFQGTWHALEQAKVAAGLSNIDYSRSEFGNYKQDVIAYDPSIQAIGTEGGPKVDVHYLQGVFETPGGVKHKSLCEPVPVPGSPNKVFRVTEQARETISQNREVGGVALAVTLDLLSFLNVSGFDRFGPSIVVESPTLISLKELHKEALPYSKSPDKWKILPEHLRYPGNVERIHGFVLDPRKNDIFLVCAPAKSQETRIDIDCLIVGLRSVWLEERTPAVSLDPLPGEIGGPQYVRVIDLPRDSLFAKTMLDADYAMKRIIFGKVKPDVDGYETLVHFIQSNKARSLMSRFWFFPTSLGSGDIIISESARSVIFESGIHVMSAQQQIVEGRTVDSGGQDVSATQAADSFTRYYDQFERSRQIEPQGIYVRLHGLVDIVTVGKLLRYMGIEYPVLHDISDLPFTKCEVPHYYQGVVTILGTGGAEGFKQGDFIMGGVHIQPRAGDYSLEWHRDSVTGVLEHAVDNFDYRKGPSISIKDRLVLSQPGYGGSEDAESIMAAGRGAMELRQYETARANFLKATEKDPLYSEAFAQLSKACALLGKFDEARAAIERAVAIEPGDKNLAAAALDIELRSNPEVDLNGWDDSTRQALSAAYIEEAVSDANHGNGDDARRKTTTALRLRDTNADAYFVRALSYPHASSPEANRDLLQAIRQYKKDLLKANDPEIRAKLARASGVHASGRLARVQEKFAGGIIETDANWAIEELSEIADEAHDAGLVDDKEPACLVVEALARATKVEVLQFMGREYNMDGVRNLVDLAVQRFPDVFKAHWTRAFVLIATAEYTEALAEIKKASELDPADGSIFLLRADLHSRQKLYAEAKTDLERAISLGAEINPLFEKKIKEGE